jgi:D-alanyl-D-alanine carboxypeptidase/D-alanyl-D-alanine-endopeptidase (penicillin-binding protein 4)
LPYYSFSNHVGITSATKRDCDAIDFSRFPGSKNVTIEGSLPDKAQPCTETLAIDDPAEYAAMALKAALEKRGVRVSGSTKVWHNDAETGGRSPISIDGLPAAYAAPGSGIAACLETVNDGPDVDVIARHSSPTLVADVTLTNKVSQNLHAEIMLRNIARLDCGSSVAYPPIVRQFLINAGLDPHDFVFYDGSGLSNHDLVTPRATAKLLQYATTQPWFALWKSSLPVGGEDGTLESRFPNPPLKDHLFAKTGTLGEALALSGYLDAASGHTLIFSIMDNNHLPGDNSDREVMDKIVAAIQASN